MKAIDQIERVNLRQLRAQSLAHAIFDAVRPFIDDEHYRDVMYALEDLFRDKGVEVLTDLDRQQYGLPARGPDGWTAEEIVALEQKRFDALFAPPPMIFKPCV